MIGFMPMTKKIVTIGGGSGHAQVLTGLKRISGIQITGICPSTDSGGSTGVLRREYQGGGYVGDLTKCMVALCNDDVLAGALSFRYREGSLSGHSVKNILFHALEEAHGLEAALREMGKICGLGAHRILPVTDKKTELCARLRIGNTISGEATIDTIAKNPLWNPDVHAITDIYLKPAVHASRVVTRAIEKSDYVIICPGDLYSSIIPVLLPRGMRSAVQKSKARIILIINIMTKRGETDNYTVRDFVEHIEKRLGRRADVVVCNSASIPDAVLLKYSLEGKAALRLPRRADDPRVLTAPLAMVASDGQIYSNPKVIERVVRKIIGRT